MKSFLKTLAGIGREVELIYKGQNYYIGCGTGKFMFWKFYDSTSEIMGKDVEDLIQKIKLDGKSVWVF